MVEPLKIYEVEDTGLNKYTTHEWHADKGVFKKPDENMRNSECEITAKDLPGAPSADKCKVEAVKHDFEEVTQRTDDGSMISNYTGRSANSSLSNDNQPMDVDEEFKR